MITKVQTQLFGFALAVILALQSWTFFEIVNLKTDVAAIKAAVIQK